MKSKDLPVSVVMSVHNGARHLRESVRSILDQQGVELEFVIVDDGSTDESPEILDRFAAGDSRVRVIRQQNTGLTRALIRGCAEARGDIIARQDADDLSLPGRLLKQALLLTSNPRTGFVSAWAQYIGPRDELLETVERPRDSAEATRRLLEERQGPPAHGSVMFRREAYEQAGGYRAEFYFGQDADLWLRMAEHWRIAYVPEVLYKWRRGFQSITGSMRSSQQRFGDLGQACRAARRLGESEEPHLAAARELTESILSDRGANTNCHQTGVAEMAYIIGSRLARQGDARAAAYLWEVLRRKPWRWRAWVRLIQSGLTFGPFRRRHV